MQTTHEKAIKYLGIATIVLAGLTLLGCLIGMVGMGALNAYSQSAYPAAGYGYGHHGMMASGSYSDAAGLALATGIANALMFWKLACAVVALIAGIMALRLKDPSAHSLRTVFIWALVAAICALLSGGFITMTLLIIIAVFAEMDRRVLDGGAPAAPKPTVTATPAPANAAYTAAYGDEVVPVAATAAVAVATEAPVDQADGPAVAENQAIAEEAAAAAATYEAEAEAVVETAEAQASEAAAAAENAHIAEEGQAAAAFYQDNAEAVTDAAPAAPTADGAVEAQYQVETTAAAVMEAEGQAEELKADEAMTKEQDSPEQR